MVIALVGGKGDVHRGGLGLAWGVLRLRQLPLQDLQVRQDGRCIVIGSLHIEDVCHPVEHAVIGTEGAEYCRALVHKYTLRLLDAVNSLVDRLEDLFRSLAIRHWRGKAIRRLVWVGVLDVVTVCVIAGVPALVMIRLPVRGRWSRSLASNAAQQIHPAPLEVRVLELPSGTLGARHRWCRTVGLDGTRVCMDDIVHLVELVHVQLPDKGLPVVVFEVVV